MTAVWVGGIFQILPALGMLGMVVGLYSLYLLYLGLPVLMKAPAEKAVAYFVVVIIAAILILGVISAVASAAFMPWPSLTGLFR